MNLIRRLQVRAQVARFLPLIAIALLALGNPPAPVYAQAESGITSPAPGSVISGDVPIIGTATIDPFQKYELYFKQDPSGDDAFIYFGGGTSPIVGGQLGSWQAGGLPGGTYTLRLRVVKADGNYAEYFVPNLTIGQGPAPTPTSSQPTETPTPTPTFTPAPQPTPVLGQVTQPQVEGDEPTPTPAQVAAVDQPAQPAEGQGLLPTPTPGDGAVAAAPATGSESGGGLTRELGESLSFQRLRTQFFNGMRISAALFIGFAAVILGKRLFGWVWRRYS